MAIALGLPFRDVVVLMLSKGDVTYTFWLIVFSIVILILAYLTNPSENSFRAYLTEQSFRYHLSRLDNADDVNLPLDRFHSQTISKTSTPSSNCASTFTAENAPSFHFANRASISLRTPKHVFHSFAIFTIAAILPSSKSSNRERQDVCMISDSWYIGAFGKWWKGGVLEEWYQDVIARSKDEESWTSGILNMKRLDMLDYKAPTFNANSLPVHLSPGTPPRLRNRERPTIRNDSVHPRSASPPPLPKSASLPMHAVRNSSRVGDTNRTRPQPHVQPCMNTENISAPPSQSSSTLFEHSPAIAEVLRQITSAKSSVADLRNQLTECQSSATQSKAALQQELNVHRNRKRQEDVSKAELKTRTKNLEDAKRTAESVKREADKKLKTAQNFRDNTIQRIEHLNTQNLQLQQKLAEDRKFISSHKQNVEEEEREIVEALSQKRLEVKAAEDQVQTLNQRSRELEERLASGKEKLRMLLEKAHNKSSFTLSDHKQQICQPQKAWVVGNGHPAILSSRQSNDQYRKTSLEYLNGIPSDREGAKGQLITASSLYDVSFNNRIPASNSSPFADASLNNVRANDVLYKSAIAKSNLMEDSPLSPIFDESGNVAKSFKSDNDPIVDKHHRTVPHAHGSLDGSSITLSSSNIVDKDHISSFNKYANSLQPSPEQVDRTWSQSSARPSKGLNPDAKEFNLSSSSTVFSSKVHSLLVPNPTFSYDALTPNGFPSATRTATNRESLLRAFALSPAERETLQRTLGGLSNTSFERLPNLSDIGSSMSSSPLTGTHALPSHLSPSPSSAASHDYGGQLPVWLQSLPRNRKVNFDPWDDEELQDTSDPPK